MGKIILSPNPDSHLRAPGFCRETTDDQIRVGPSRTHVMMRSARNQDMITQQTGIEGVATGPSAAETSGTRGAAARSETRHRTLLASEVDRMRYFRDLLRAGRGAALRPGSGGETLRRDRIALRIPLPELDAVPLWSVRRADGMISIPFIEYIIGQMLASAQRIGRAAGLEEGEDALVEVRSLRRALVQVNSGDPRPSSCRG